jgi:hypothetical protein
MGGDKAHMKKMRQFCTIKSIKDIILKIKSLIGGYTKLRRGNEVA